MNKFEQGGVWDERWKIYKTQLSLFPLGLEKTVIGASNFSFILYIDIVAISNMVGHEKLDTFVND